MRKTKNIFVVCLLMGLAGPLWAQDNELERAFDTFATQQSQAFDDFKSKADADFESFLRETWQAFDAFEPEIAPVRPEPVNPVEFDKSGPAVSPVDIRPDEVKMGEPSQEPVEVPVPSVEAGQPSRRSTMTFYGTDVKVAVDALKGFSLGGIQEGDVADAWRAVCGMDYEPLLSDCLRIRKEYHLGDWAYLQLTKLIGLQLYGKERPDEVAFLQMFLMNKSGYKVRLAKIDNGLHLLVAPGSTIYGSPYLRLNGEKYYVFEPQAGASMRIYTYKQDFADSKNRVSLSMTDVPLFSMAEELRTFASADGRVEVQVAVNRNLMDFYRDYPQCDVVLHYKTPMSGSLREELYRQLKPVVEGRSQAEAAGVLLDFVQTSFRYMTDGEQFGYEKPFFPDETFYYPYCDCEDRAMLYATLVKDLLGLKVVLLDYPDHIASAVCFTEKVPGDAVVLADGSRYVICDPTYIGAPVGRCMDSYKNVSPDVIF